MKLIAHRGNITGQNKEYENTIDYLFHAIDLGFDVEVDIWSIDNTFFLGHDQPNQKINQQHVNDLSEFAWFHAKNHEAIFALLTTGHNVFFHDIDAFTLTSFGLIWTYPGQPVNSKSIVVMPETTPHFKIPPNVFGVCSDNLHNLTFVES